MSAPRVVLQALLILGLVAGAGFAQSSYVVVDSVRLPAQSFVGDPVELRYTVRTEAVPVVPDEIPQPRWGEISGLRVIPQPGGFDLRMTATPYEPGTLTIPRLELGALRIDGLSISVRSVLEPGDARVRPVLSPQRLPGTNATILLFALLLIGGTSLAIYLLGPGSRHLRRFLERHRARAPYKRLLSRLSILERDIKRLNLNEFYSGLYHELQLFMDGRLPSNCRAATATELVGRLPELASRCGARPGIAEPLAEVLQTCDMARFAHRMVRRKKRIRHLVVTRAVAVELESHRRVIGRNSARKKEAIPVTSEGGSRVGA